MKKSLLVLLGVLGLGNLHAQTSEEVVVTNKFRDNWSIGLNAGGVSPLTHSAFLNNMRPTVGLGINKQFSPVYGLTLESMYSINTTGAPQAFDAFNLMLLNRVNLNHMFARYKGKPSVFEVEAVAGLGWLKVFDYYPTATGADNANHVASKAGLNFNFNLGEAKAWTLAVKPAILWDMNIPNQSHLNFNANHAVWEISAGIVYHFKNSTGKHYLSKVKTYDYREVSTLNATINTLRQESSSKDQAIQGFRNALRDEEQKSASLESALNECRKQGPKIITNSKKTLESVITFRQGRSTIDASQQPNVERIATYLKNHDDVKVVVLGYASPEGSEEVNARIAYQRAQAVKDMLVTKYRIDEKRITAEGQGVGNMFEEPDWNRVSICTIVEKDNK